MRLCFLYNLRRTTSLGHSFVGFETYTMVKTLQASLLLPWRPAVRDILPVKRNNLLLDKNVENHWSKDRVKTKAATRLRYQDLAEVWATFCIVRGRQHLFLILLWFICATDGLQHSVLRCGLSPDAILLVKALQFQCPEHMLPLLPLPQLDGNLVKTMINSQKKPESRV